MAYTLLNQIFYKHNKFDTQDDLQALEPYSLNVKFIQQYTRLIQSLSKVESQPVELPTIGGPTIVSPIMFELPKVELPKVELPKHRNFSPRKDDTLFWSIYVLHHGEAEYTMIGGKYKNVELQEKQNIMVYIQKNRALIKSCAQTNGVKLSNVRIQETTAEIMVNKKTSWYVFHVMCMYYKINAIISQNEIYMKFMVDPEYDTYLFERNSDGHFSVDVVPMIKEQLMNIESTCLNIDPFLPKILKGVSTYKTTELEEMGKKLGVSPDIQKPKKNDWYDVIINKLVKMLII